MGARGAVDLIVDHAKTGLNTAGEMVLLAWDSSVSAATDIVRGRFSWDEFFEQAWFMTRVSLLPTILVSIPFGVIVSVQVGGVAGQIGAQSFIGAVNAIGVMRQAAPLVAAIMIAGVVGAAVTADLGARTVREEIDALKVMGISPVQRLVAPRLVAAVIIGVCLSAVVATTAILTGYVLVVGSGSVSSGTYLGAFISFGQTLDLIMAILKSAIFGFLAVIVAAHKGLNARGGPKGVSDAVNQSVVLSVILLALVNVGITQLYVMLVPQRLV
ncbi:ABC transporter permease [Nocardioides humilatus]|uniref:ABC transporter permease n=2 Tax=Nocardioides humilatus TaxID=2607660 RepID=A0A5B1LJC5_9ACTN|nr:ABC transporter permease [Nocardioides humilatus]